MAKIEIRLDRSEERALEQRSKEMMPCSNRLDLEKHVRVVHFLRGVQSEAQVLLPAFYLHLATTAVPGNQCAIKGYPGIVFHHAMARTAVATITLTCRKAFDAASGQLTAGMFAKIGDNTLMQVATYYADSSSRPRDDAYAALLLLQSVFRECTAQTKLLFESEFSLCRRVALLTQHANRSGAHLTLETYKFSMADCAHVVGALTLIGEIVRYFDSPADADYFSGIDDAAFNAAAELFPGTPFPRLFNGMDIEEQARLCWVNGIDPGRRLLLSELPYAIGWF